MLRKIITGVSVAALFLTAGFSLRAQSYSNAVMALSPSAYWPLNETTQPPMPLNLTALNLGSVGAVGNGFYGAWYQPSGTTWYLTNNIAQTNAYTYPFDGSSAMLCQGQPGQYVILPRNTNGVANTNLTLNPPFSIEAWLKIGTISSALGSIVSQGGSVNLNSGGPNTNNPFYGGLATSWAGVELGQYQDYLFLLCQNTNSAGTKSSELDTSSYNTFKGFKVGAWVHVVATFDGSTEAIWTNGNLCVSKSIGANGAGLKYVADPTSPIMIGCGSDATAVYGQGYQGTIHDVAIYNTVLSQTSIQNHWQTANGTNATYGSVYTNAVLADNPLLYYRLNDSVNKTSAGYPTGTFPVANNYGSLGSAADGVYQPGTTPGVSGPPYAGFGAQSTAVAFNGWLGGVDVGSGAIPASLNPTNTSPLTVVTWFQTGPADAPGRFQNILGHGNNSYRFGLGQAAGENHFNPGPGPELQFVSPADVVTNGFAFNDNKWHMIAGVTDGTNEYMYLDGVLAKSASNTTNGINITGSTNDLLIGGDTQFTTASFNTSNSVRTFDGQVAHVAFWNSALSASNIQQLFNAAGVPPYFVFEPKSVTTNAGNPVTISSSVRGSAALDYQWYQNDARATGQTNNNLVFSSITTAANGSWYLVATNPYGAITSSIINITVYGPPTVQQQTSTDVQVFAGTSPTLHVLAVGASPIHYQWTLNGSSIPGATNTALALPNIQNGGTYGCNMSNFVSTGAISPIAVNVLTDPTAPFPVKVLADSPMDYFRLDETSGTIAFDYAGANNGTYTNVTLGEPGYTSEDPVQSDPTETSVEFGDYPPNNNDAGGIPPWLNFGTPNGSSAEFSVEAWFTQFFYVNGGDAIVALGYGNGGEQFVLDTGNGSSGAVRFFVRNAAGTVSSANGSAVVANDGKWHHMVGVCDEAHGHVYLYLDGVQVANGTIATNSGILAATSEMTIGARESGDTGTNDFQFLGRIDDVAVYNYALSAAQVSNHYSASGIAPAITGLLPSNQVTTNQGGTVTLTVSASGTSPLSYQWYDNNGNPIPSATNTVLTLNNLQPSQAGDYEVIVTNLYGSANTNADINVDLGPPQLVTDLSPLFETNYETTPFTYSIVVAGSTPFSYQWYQNGTAVAGATNSAYSFPIPLGTNYYYCAVTNSYSYSQGSGPIYSSTGTVVGLPATILNPANYTDRMKITFSGYNRGETLHDFPALVVLGTNVPGFSYQHFASPTGGDLRFSIDTNNSLVLPSEIDEWNPNGESYVWVQVPALAATNDYIWAFWGNPSAAEPPASDTNGAVWLPPAFAGQPGYDVVYHMDQTSLPFYDSTLQYPATNGNPPVLTNGIVGHGGFFNGTAYLDAGAINLSNQFTLSAWINMENLVNIQTMWANQLGGYGKDGFCFYINSYNNLDYQIRVETGNGTIGDLTDSATGAVTPNTWHMLACVMDRSDGIGTVYLDGVNVTTANAIRTDFSVTNAVYLGEFDDNNFGFHGVIDEARIQSGTNSANWIWANYMTVASNSVFQTYGSLSSTAVVISAQVVNGQLILTWPSGTLQSAATVNGPYSNVNGATSPYSVPATGPGQYYRVKVH